MSIGKVLVTGSSGTIGTRLCERMLQDGTYEVVGVDRRPNAWNAQVQAVTVAGDLREEATLARLPTDVDVVIHLAANARVYELVEAPELARDNFLTLFNILEFCRRNGIPRFQFASSREVYGNTGEAVHAEEPVRLGDCESPYSASKLGGEALVHSYGRCYGLDYIIFRFSNVYGMYDDSERVVPLFIRQTRAGRDLTVFGEDKLLDFTYIDDAVDGILLSLERFERARNDTYNLAFGEGTTILAVAGMIREQLGATNRVHLGESRTGEVVRYIADTRKAREKLRFAPRVTCPEGIARSVAWYRANVPAPA
jgi:UDP-glucose 4-epimerase